jgi:hypothetical protein
LESAILNWRKRLKQESTGSRLGVLVYRKLAKDLESKVLAAGGAPTKEQYRDWALGYLREAARYASVIQTNPGGKKPKIFRRKRKKREPKLKR